MSEATTKGLRERLTNSTEDRLGKALTDLFENSLLTGALGRAAEAREKATQAQELAMGALNLPSAADVERLTRRLRAVSQRLEGIEDGVHRLGRTFPGQSIDARLGAIEEQLKTLSATLGEIRAGSTRGRPATAASAGAEGGAAKAPKPSATKPRRTATAARKAPAKGKASARAKAPAKAKAPRAAKTPAKRSTGA